MKSPMAPGRITSLRTAVPVSQKQKRQASIYPQKMHPNFTVTD